MKTQTSYVLMTLTLATIAMTPFFSSAEPAPNYVVTKSIPLGAPDRWDYITYDSHAHRIYVAHGDRVTVVDGNSDAVVGQVEGMPGGTQDRKSTRLNSSHPSIS